MTASPSSVKQAEEVLTGQTLPSTQRPPSRRPGFYEKHFKRPLDLAAAVILLLATLPLMALVALGVFLTMGGPVLFHQDRLGKEAVPFSIVKFRTMRPDRRAQNLPFVGPDRRQTHKSEADPRHTRYGRFLRRTSLDELPQLWNVIRGEMSLVGPRPELPEVARKHNIVEHPRHTVRPGITGAWQISPERSHLVHPHVHLDTAYVERLSARSDARILVKTVGALAKRAGI